MLNKNKVLVISYLFPNSVNPGFGIFVLRRLQALCRYCDFIVINPIPWFPFSHKLKRYKDYDKIPFMETIEGVKVYHPRFVIVPGILKFIDPFTFLLSVFPLAAKLRKNFQFNLIDIHWTYPDILSGNIIARFYGLTHIVNVRGKAGLNIFLKNGGTVSSNQEKSIRTLILNFFLKRADSVVCVSRELGDISKKLGVLPSRIKVIPNGVDPEIFYYMDQQECRKKLNLSLEKKIVLSVGNLIYGKGFDRIISVLKHFPDLEFVVAGSVGPAGDYQAELKQMIKDNQVAAQVKFLGRIDQDALCYWYNAADVFCLASRTEGSPNVLNEALACGCPSVATDVGTANEVLNSDQMGVCVPNSRNGLKNGLEHILKTDFNRPDIAERQRHKTWHWCGQAIHDNYQKSITV